MPNFQISGTYPPDFLKSCQEMYNLILKRPKNQFLYNNIPLCLMKSDNFLGFVAYLL